MTKSAIYTALNTSSPVAVGAIIPLGTTIRRFGCNLVQEGNNIAIRGAGFYAVNVSATVEPDAAGTVTIRLTKDGVDVPGGIASGVAGAIGDPVNLSFAAIVRDLCGCVDSDLGLVLGGTDATVTNLAVVVERL